MPRGWHIKWRVVNSGEEALPHRQLRGRFERSESNGSRWEKVIKQAFPEAFKADQATPKGSRAKLGSLSTATVERSGRKVTIINGYTQFHWRGAGVLVDYIAVRSVLRRVKAMLPGRTLAYPKIGASLAKGD
jgi:hypothetical protein